MEPASTSAGASIALIKYFGLQLMIGAVASSLAFIVLPPKSKMEFFSRMLCTLVASYLFGPLLVVAVHSWYPSLFHSAQELAVLNGQNVSFGILYISAPLQVIAGMPAWWIVGAFMRWFERRQNEDIGDWAADFRNSFLPSNWHNNTPDSQPSSDVPASNYDSNPPRINDDVSR